MGALQTVVNAPAQLSFGAGRPKIVMHFGLGNIFGPLEVSFGAIHRRQTA